MKFEIIKNSQSNTGYDIPDNEYKGVIPGLCCGWQFEFERDGKLGYGSVSYYEGTPEEYIARWDEYEPGAAFMGAHMNGYTETGRVIFRGYAEEYYDSEEREWFVKDVEV